MQLLGVLSMELAQNVDSRTDVPLAIARLLDNPTVLFVARLALVCPYLASGVTKLVDWPAGLAEMAHVGLHPTWLFNLAVLVTELGGSVLILLNRLLWLGAGALGVFTVLTIFLAHDFWNLTGALRAEEMTKFFEHLTICSAFIFVTVADLRVRREMP